MIKPETKANLKSLIRDVVVMCLIALIIGFTLYWISNRINDFLNTEMGPFKETLRKWY